MKALNCSLWLLFFAFILLDNVFGYLMIVTMPVKPNKARKKCTPYTKRCIPGRSNCCGSLVCTNILQSYCLYPFESCYCMTTSFYNTDSWR